MPVVSGISFQLSENQAVKGAPVIVLIHGAGGNHLYWPFNIRRLPGYRVYAPDLPGHGKSGGVGEQAVEGYTRALLDWLQVVGLEQVVLVGHSMGSAIALQLALEKPEMVTGLGLLGSSARLKVNPALIAGASQVDTFLQTIDTIIQWSFSLDAPADLTRLASRRMAEVSPGVLYNDFLACNAFDLTARLAEIRCPTLVICGAQDKMTPPNQAQYLAAQIPVSRLEVVPHAGHIVMLEQPFTVAEILTRFLSEIG